MRCDKQNVLIGILSSTHSQKPLLPSSTPTHSPVHPWIAGELETLHIYHSYVIYNTGFNIFWVLGVFGGGSSGESTLLLRDQ